MNKRIIFVAQLSFYGSRWIIPSILKQFYSSCMNMIIKKKITSNEMWKDSPPHCNIFIIISLKNLMSELLRTENKIYMENSLINYLEPTNDCGKAQFLNLEMD